MKKISIAILFVSLMIVNETKSPVIALEGRAYQVPAAVLREREARQPREDYFPHSRIGYPLQQQLQQQQEVVQNQPNLNHRKVQEKN